MRVSAKVCIHCGTRSRPLPVFWFSFLSVLFVAYALLDVYGLV